MTAPELEKLLSPRELAVLAAQRRARDSVCCGNGDTTVATTPSPGSRMTRIPSEDTSTLDSTRSAKRKREDDLANSSDSIIQSSQRPSGQSSTSSLIITSVAPSVVSPIATTTSTTSTSVSSTALLPLRPDRDSDPLSWDCWSCPSCTLENPALLLQCTCCLTVRPPHL
jgi:hypothetical protein